MAKATASKKSQPAKKPAIKKVAPKKAIAKKAAPKKVVAKKPVTSAKGGSASGKKVAVKKPAVKKLAPKKITVKKVATKKGSAKKTVVKKVAVKQVKTAEPEQTITQIELTNRAAYATTTFTEPDAQFEPVYAVAQPTINERLDAPEPIARWRVWLGVFAISLGIFGVWVYSLQFTVLAGPAATAQNQDIDELVDDVSDSYSELESSVSNIKNRYEELNTADSNSTAGATTNPKLNTDELDQLFSDLQ